LGNLCEEGRKGGEEGKGGKQGRQGRTKGRGVAFLTTLSASANVVQPFHSTTVLSKETKTHFPPREKFHPTDG
jgi:hypothetical protein